MNVAKLPNIQLLSDAVFSQKLDDRSIPREVTGIDRYHVHANSQSVPREK
jgi:hypothetical protein